MPSISFSSNQINTVASIVLLSISAACSDSINDQNVLDTTLYTSIFGENVLVFEDSMDQDFIKMTLEEIHEQQKYSEFGSERYALLFKPGTYDFDVKVDYYVQA